MNNETRLWFTHAKSGKKNLISTITSSSKFNYMKSRDLSTENGRHKAAQEIAAGWDQCGPMGAGKWEIEHRKSDPIVLSDMASEIIRKSRENIGVQ